MEESAAQALVSRSLAQLSIGATAEGLLERFVQQEATASQIADLLHDNPLYEAALRSYVQSKLGAGSSSDAMGAELSIHRAVSLLGVLGTRNLVLTLRLSRMRGQPWPFHVEPKKAEVAAAVAVAPDKKKAAKAEVKLDLEASLAFALKAQEFCQSTKILDPEGLGFWGGLNFDLQLSLLYSDGKKFNAVKPVADKLYRQALKPALIAARLGDRVPGFGYSRMVFGAALLLGAGKLAAHVHSLKPGFTQSAWLDYEKSIEKIPELGRREIKTLKEREFLGWSHEEFAAALATNSGGFRLAAASLRNLANPYFLKGWQTERYQLAACLWLAKRIAEEGKILESGKPPLSTLLAQPWVKDLRLKEKDLIEVAKEAASVSY